MVRDSFEEDDSARLRRRLWGAAVLIAIAVIVLPWMLDGAGSESQFRRVEQLREEPPAIVDVDGSRSVQVVPESPSVPDLSSAANALERVVKGDQNDDQISESLPTEPQNERQALKAGGVLAGEFIDENQALQLRDLLRRADFASFVKDRDGDSDPFRVLVGPMIKQESAERARQRVAALLQNSPTLQVYP